MRLEKWTQKLALWITSTPKIWVTVFMLACGSCVFLPNPEISSRLGREMVFGWCLIVFIAVNLNNIWFSLFLIWSVVNMTLNYNSLGLGTVMTITLFMVAYDRLVPILRKKSLSFWLNCVCFSAVLQLELCLFQYLNGDFIFSKSCDGSLCGFLDNPTLLSAYLVFCLPAFFRKYWCCFIPVIVSVVLFNDNKMSLLALGLMTVFYLSCKIRKRTVKTAFATGLIILILVGLIFMDKHVRQSGIKHGLWSEVKRQSSRRVIYWPRIFRLNNESVRRSLLGYGPGQFKWVYNVKYIDVPPCLFNNNGSRLLLTQAHCEPLQLQTEWGYVGVLIILGLLTSLWIKFKRNKGLLLPMCGLVAVAVNCLGSFPLHIPGLAFIALFYVAVIEGHE